MAIGPILRYGWTQIKEDDKRKGKKLAQLAQRTAARTIYHTQIYIHVYSIILYIIVQLHNNTGKTKRDKYNYIHVYIYLHIHIYNC